MREPLVIQSTMIGTMESPRESEPWLSEDQRVAAACAQGDPVIFEELYSRHADRMKSVAYHHLGTRTEAEEAVQETFLKIHRSAGTYKADAPFISWAYRILINTCHDIVRQRARRAEELPVDIVTHDFQASRSSDDALRATLRKLISRLKEQQRSVFLLYEVEGMSHREIGEVLDIRESYSKWLLHAAKRRLQAMLHNEEVAP